MESLERRDLLSALPSDGPVDERLHGNESASQARAYVANLRSDFVSSIDITTNSVVSQIPVGAGQFAIDVSPDGTRAYAALVDCSDLNCDPWGRVHDVAVIDTVAGRVLTTIHDVGLHLVDVTVSPRGDIVLLTDHLNNVVRVLSTSDNSIVASIPVGSAPDQLAISPDGRLAYVSNVLSATVSVIDTTMLTVVATIGGVGAGANTVSVSPDGGRVYVGSHWNGVSVIDARSNSVIANIPLNSPNGPVVAMSLAPDGKKLYVTDRHHGFVSEQTPNNVWVVNTETNSVEARISIDAVFGGGLVVSSDGAVVYASSTTEDMVLAIDAATNQVIKAIPVGHVPQAIAFGLAKDSEGQSPFILLSGLEQDGIATDEDVPTNEIHLVVGDAETPADQLSVTVQSSNPELIAAKGIVLSGSGANRTLVLTPAANLYGIATIVVSVSDGEATVKREFVLTVNPVNDAPTISDIGSQSTAEDIALTDIAFSIGDVDSALDDLSVTATSSNSSLVPNGNIEVHGTGASRSLRILPAVNQSGTATITVRVSDGSASTTDTFVLTVTPVKDLPTIVTIANQTEFKISANARMPTVVADLKIFGSTVNISRTRVRWTAQVRFMGSETAHGVAGTPLNVVKTTTGGHLVINPGDWGKVRGGSLKLIATATINGKEVTATLENLHITGTNPSVAKVRRLLGTDTLRQIAHQESNYRQFGSDGYPLFSSDNFGGAGIMQITPASEDQRWDWRANVQAGIAKYQSTYNLSATYVTSLRSSKEFSALVSAINQDRANQHLRTLTVTIPSFTNDQRTEDAIRGYNGWAGSDPIVPTLHLHEFRLARDANGRLRLKLIAGTNRAEAIWERVPTVDRPQGTGDPDYVNHVLAQTP